MKKLLPYILLICALCWVAQAAVFMRGTPAPAAAPGGPAVGTVEFDKTMFWYVLTNASCASGSYIDNSYGGGNDATQATAEYIGTWSADEGGTVWFDHTNDCIDLPTNTTTAFRPYSIALWVKLSPNPATYDAAYSERYTPGTDKYLSLFLATTNHWYFYGYDGTAVRYIIPTIDSDNPGAWRFIVGTYTTNLAIFYCNGLEVGRDTSCDMSAFTELADEYHLAQGAYTGYRNFGGWIGEAIKWSVPIASQSVWACWATNKATYGL